MAGPPPHERALEPLGEAERFACADGRELWRLPVARAAAADELLALGHGGVGGFIEGGRDERGPWLVREAAATKLAALLGTHEGHPLPWRGALELVTTLARAYAAAEARELFPGLLRPTSVILEPQVWITAEPIVHAHVGGVLQESPESQLRREWLTPAAAAGQADDASSNRWLLGLLLYRLLCGQGPFAGLGLRSAIDRLSQGVPPLPEAIARELPPGLQGLLLRILAPDPAARPRDAASLHDELARFLGREAQAAKPIEPKPIEPKPVEPKPIEHRTLLHLPSRAAEPTPAPSPAPARASWQPGPSSTAPSSTATRDETPTPVHPDPAPARVDAQPTAVPTTTPRPAKPARRSAWTRVGRVAAVIGVLWLGIAGGNALVELVGEPAPATTTKQPSANKPKIGDLAALDAAHTSPDDCASCHPRQTAEWKRSVMGHSAKSPLFQALEMLIEEQVGRSDDCPGGAGILRTADPRTACRDPNTGIAITGSGGALWCVNCHTPRENLGAVLPAWDGRSFSAATRQPLRDLQPASTTEGIDCGFCHQVHGPVRPGNERNGQYEGNPSWISTATGRSFAMRPEDRLGLVGIANSGYALDPAELLSGFANRIAAPPVPGGVHRRPTAEAQAYLRSSEFCGACHDVRLFGADAIGTPAHGEPFRRLRNAYSEWAQWAALERRAGREPADCQDCHMSNFPGVCVAGDPQPPVPGQTDLTALRRGCPEGTHFESRAPGEFPSQRVAANSSARDEVTTHYFSGVDIPLTPEFDAHFIDQPELDALGIPLGGDQRRDLLLGRSFRFGLGQALVRGRTLELPVEIENTGAGHKIPAGFSQEREFWVHLRITDARGQLVYEVGRVDRSDEDLRDKIFLRVNVDDRIRDAQGQPLGMFGADIIDGPDIQQWRALDGAGRHEASAEFRGRGLINLQNGFLRCVQCIGFVDRAGRCQAVGDEQREHRAARFADAPFDLETGECNSNLFGDEALFETYFPVGSLDATRGVTKGPDAIIDARSAPPGVPLRWTYELPISSFEGPLTIEARLLFRAFPPFLIKAFADYEARQAALGLRPSGPLVTRDMLAKLEVVEIATVTRELELTLDPLSGPRRPSPSPTDTGPERR